MLSAYGSAFRGEVVELVEGAALEMLYTLIAYRGFESLPLLQYIAGLCKGSTTDSDSVCLGSNPSPAATKPCHKIGFLFLYNFICLTGADRQYETDFKTKPHR